MTDADGKPIVFAVEDEAIIALDLADLLDELGYRVQGPFSTVESALAHLKNLNAVPDAAPDAAIVDVNLGGVSAKPVVEALRARDVPLVLASGYERAELAQFGLDDEPILRKPYKAEEVQQALMETAGLPARMPQPGALKQPDL